MEVLEMANSAWPGFVGDTTHERCHRYIGQVVAYLASTDIEDDDVCRIEV